MDNESRHKNMTQPTLSGRDIDWKMTLMVVLWPAFLMATVSCGVIFSLIDPLELVVLDKKVKMPMFGVYTLGFLLFWALGTLSSLITVFLLKKVK